MGRTAGSFLLCNLCVSAVCKGQRRRHLLRAAACGSVSALNPCILGMERSNKEQAGPCDSRFQTFTSSLKNWCSRGWLLAEKRNFFFFFWCKGIRINTRIKNYAQHPLVWKESSLRLAPLPLDVPRAGQLLPPRGGCAPAPGSPCSAGGTERTVRTSARPAVTGAAGSSARGPPPYNIVSSHQLPSKYFLKRR